MRDLNGGSGVYEIDLVIALLASLLILEPALCKLELLLLPASCWDPATVLIASSYDFEIASNF